MMGSPSSPGPSRNTKSTTKFKSVKRNLSYADLHSELMKDTNNVPSTSSGIKEGQQNRSTEIENEELVKYMSKLPSFLEKGEKVQDKPLNIGVLNWRSLESWQYYHPKASSKSSRCSAPSSISSQNFLNDGPSNRQIRGNSCSPPSRKGRRPTLESFLNISPVEDGHFEFVESSPRNASKFCDIEAVPSNRFDGQQNILKEFQFFNKKSSEIKLKESKKNNLDLQSIPKTRTSKNFEKYGAPSSSKGKSKVRDFDLSRESEKLKNQYENSFRIDSPDSQKNVVLILPREGAGSKHSATSRSFETNGHKSTETSRAISEGFHFEEVYRKDICPRNPVSCPLPRDSDGIKESQVEQHITVDAASANFLRSPSYSIKSVSPARNKIPEEKSTMIPVNSTVTMSSKGSDMKMGTVSAKVRNSSPTSRFSMGLGKIGRSSNPEDVSACSNNSSIDKPNPVSRDRTSPLRRLLDPLLKPKAANSSKRASTSFDVRGESSSSVHPTKVKLELPSLRTDNFDNLHHNEKKGPSTQQAYLQIAVKNDLPLYTFAVDNNSEVLAATVRKFSSRKDEPTWIYTFFTIHEIKKKNGGWLNQGSKSKDYIPNVVAQMKVSDLPFPNLGGQHFGVQFSTREFVLVAVDLRPFDQQTSDVQPNDELAAILVKFPKKASLVYPFSRDLQENGEAHGSQELFSTTVILPGGVHGLPSKGEPSPLIERWLSGGQCDCGGWDMGCKVKVLGSRSQNPIGRFELFSQSQEEVIKSTPLFSLCLLKNEIFSVEFDSSISLLQAFSICISVIDSRKPCELQQSSNFFQEKLAGNPALLENSGIKTPKQVRVHVPAIYVSPPPHSPAGRV